VRQIVAAVVVSLILASQTYGETVVKQSTGSELSWPAGGQTVNDVELVLVPQRCKWEIGEIPQFNFHVVNRGDSKIRLSTYNICDIKFSVKDAAGNVMEFLKRNPKPIPPEPPLPFDPAVHTVGIEPGGRIVMNTSILTIERFYIFGIDKPGKYTVQASITADRKGEYEGIPFWNGNVESNPVMIEIVDWKTPEGTPPAVDGLQIELYLDMDSLLQGEQLPAYLVFRNTGEQPLKIWNWNYSWGYFNDSFEVTSGDSSQKWNMAVREWGKNFPGTTEIAPGKTVTRQISVGGLERKPVDENKPGDIPRAGVLPPGIYNITAVHSNKQAEEWNVKDVWAGQIKSNMATFVVKPVSTIEKVRAKLPFNLNLAQPVTDNNMLRLTSKQFIWSTVYIVDSRMQEQALPKNCNVAFDAQANEIIQLNSFGDWIKVLKKDGVKMTDLDTVKAAVMAGINVTPGNNGGWMLQDKWRIDYYVNHWTYTGADVQMPVFEKEGNKYSCSLWLMGRNNEMINRQFTITAGWNVKEITKIYQRGAEKRDEIQQAPKTTTPKEDTGLAF